MGEKADPSSTGSIGQLTWALCVMPASTTSEITPNIDTFITNTSCTVTDNVTIVRVFEKTCNKRDMICVVCIGTH